MSIKGLFISTLSSLFGVQIYLAGFLALFVCTLSILFGRILGILKYMRNLGMNGNMRKILWLCNENES